jgi:hypothetical protein
VLGAVANPGPRFILTTVVTLTASAMTAMWLWESQWHSDKAPAAGETDDVDRESPTVQAAGDRQLLNAPAPALEIVQPAREKVGLK